MSFAEDVKNEVAHLKPENTACCRAELTALLCMGGSLILGSHGALGIEFSTSNNAVARKALVMWRSLFPRLRPEVRVRQGLKLRKKNYYILRLTPSLLVRETLCQLSLFPTQNELAQLKLCDTASQQAFLRGAFMGGGSVNQPKGDYHLELVTGSANLAQKLYQLMRQMHLPAKHTDRKGDYLVYLKEGNGVSSFLQYIGADQAYLQFESARVLKSLRNNVNRVVNCETANLQKTVDAAFRQRQAITAIQASGHYQELSAKLREVAELRLSHPESSMGELAALSGLTKSGLSHRFKKITDIARHLEGQKHVEI